MAGQRDIDDFYRSRLDREPWCRLASAPLVEAPCGTRRRRSGGGNGLARCAGAGSKRVFRAGRAIRCTGDLLRAAYWQRPSPGSSGGRRRGLCRPVDSATARSRTGQRHREHSPQSLSGPAVLSSAPVAGLIVGALGSVGDVSRVSTRLGRLWTPVPAARFGLWGASAGGHLAGIGTVGILPLLRRGRMRRSLAKSSAGIAR